MIDKFIVSLITKTIVMLLIGFFIFVTLFTITYRIKPGEVGVIVNQLGQNKGVDDKELTVGLHFVLPWKSVYKFPIYEQNHQWVKEEGFNFQTAEGLSVHADIGINYNLEPSKIHDLFYKYRRGMDEITHLFIKNNIRDAMNRVASKLLIEDLYGPKKELFFSEVQQIVSNELNQLGFNISHIFIIGKFEVPNIVMEALNRKIEATQRAQQRENELRESEAQAKKEIAIVEGKSKSKIIAAKAEAESLLIESKARAQANSLITTSLTKDLIKWESVNKWNGVLPHAVAGEGMPILLNLE